MQGKYTPHSATLFKNEPFILDSRKVLMDGLDPKLNRVKKKIPENLILDRNLKNQSAKTPKAIPETPATMSLHQDSLCKEGFEASEYI